MAHRKGSRRKTLAESSDEEEVNRGASTSGTSTNERENVTSMMECEDATLADDPTEHVELYSKYVELTNRARDILKTVEEGSNQELYKDDAIKKINSQSLGLLKTCPEIEIVMADMNLMQIVFKSLIQGMNNIDPGKNCVTVSALAEEIKKYCEIDEEETDDNHTEAYMESLGQIVRSIWCFKFDGLSISAPLKEQTNTVIKIAKPRERKPKDIVKDAIQPEKVNKVTGRTMESTVCEVVKILEKRYKENNKRPVDFFEFILDPNSFSRTVENLFHLSFAINTNDADISTDRNTKLPVVEPAEKCEEFTREHSSAVVAELTYEDWEELIGLLDIDEPMLDLEELPDSAIERKKARLDNIASTSRQSRDEASTSSQFTGEASTSRQSRIRTRDIDPDTDSPASSRRKL